MNITIIGTGYVGLVTGACFAETGNHVTCLDIDAERITGLKKGKIPFFEPNLEKIVLNNIKAGRLIFSNSYEEACKNSVFFLCVGTPDRGDGESDLSGIESVLNSLSDNLSGENFVVTKSTVPLGTNRYIQEYLDSRTSKEAEVTVVSNPEFLKEGSAVNDFLQPDRIVVGTTSSRAKKIMQDLHKPFNRRSNRILFMSVDSAELTKYAANSFLATKISFINEMAVICEKTGANIHEVRLGMGSDKRIGHSFLYAGLGYGGSCFPKDVKALIQAQKKLNIKPRILESAEIVNGMQVEHFLEKILNNLSEELSSKTLAIWGLSFKPNTDDVRDSVAIKLIKKLSPLVERLNLYDPVATENAKIELSEYDNLSFFTDKEEALIKANALIVTTEWKEFCQPNLKSLDVLEDRIIFDGRNILNAEQIRKNGFTYIGIGI